MELTPDIIKMFRTKQETKWNTVIQQDTELVKPFVSIPPNCRGKSVELPFHGKTKMKEYTGRLLKIEWSEMDFGKRHIKPRKFYDSIPLSEDDKLEMDTLDLRAAEVMTEQRNALTRMHDEVILSVSAKCTRQWLMATCFLPKWMATAAILRRQPPMNTTTTAGRRRKRALMEAYGNGPTTCWDA